MAPLATTPAAALGPADGLRLLAHPIRWQLVTSLAESDRTVRELTAVVAEPQSLVSYHLGKLRTADVVSSRRSSADGRDAYYRARIDRIGALLRTAGGTVHPELGAPVPPWQPADGASARVLVLCTGNSARSQMAEALLTARSGGRIRAASAGSRPKPLHPLAVAVMAEDHGLDIAGWRSKHLDEFRSERFDRIVTVCDRVREVCPEFPGPAPHVHWSMADPSAAPDDDRGTSLAAFRSTAQELDERIALLIPTLLAPARP